MNQKILLELNSSLSELYGSHNLNWSPSYIQKFPKKFVKYGDLLLLSHSAFVEEHWKVVDQKELLTCIANIFKVNRIAQQGKIQSDDHRTPSVKMLLGEDSRVTQVDNKISYTFDIRKCMFSSGNITEKIRIAKLNCENEIVVDMFAGIGYFTLPLLVHAKAKLVHACEWNENAVEALRENLINNKVSDRCVVHPGDNRKVAPAGVANRILLGLIPSAQASYEAACRSLNRSVGGIMHVHENVSSKRNPKSIEKSFPTVLDTSQMTCNRKMKPEWKSWALDTAWTLWKLLIAADDDLNTNINADPATWLVKLLHIERVKSYAPHIDHLVLDIQFFPGTKRHR